MTTTDYPTYSLRTRPTGPGAYPTAVAKLADAMMAMGADVRPTVEAYGNFVAETGCEERRSYEEYLLEALMIGVLWRARGHEAMVAARAHGETVQRLVGERRAGCGRRRDGSNAALVLVDGPFVPGRPDPTTDDFTLLLAWLLASGEYDDEFVRLEGWQEFFATVPAADSLLRSLVRFAEGFESASVAALGAFTAQVDGFVQRVLPLRGPREDTVQCSRRRVEYHFNMVGAEILNRAWRADFVACERHVVVLPGCARRRADAQCLARRTDTELRCTDCAAGCTVAEATKVAARAGAEALAVVHGSDFGRFLRSPALSGGKVGIVGVACVPGLVGAGWRARAQGLPAQCVLLESSGCAHWRDHALPTSVDLAQLAGILVEARDVGNRLERTGRTDTPASAAPAA
jgi:hypothetical protein